MYIMCLEEFNDLLFRLNLWICVYIYMIIYIILYYVLYSKVLWIRKII